MKKVDLYMHRNVCQAPLMIYVLTVAGRDVAIFPSFLIINIAPGSRLDCQFVSSLIVLSMCLYVSFVNKREVIKSGMYKEPKLK